MNGKAALLAQATTALKANETNLLDRIDTLLSENKEMKQAIAKAQAERAKVESNKLLMALKEYDGVNVVVGKIQVENMNELRDAADNICG